MKKNLFLLFLVIFILFGNNNSNAQSLNLPGGIINIGPVLMGESSPDGANYFNVTGSGYADETVGIYVDSYDSRFTLSLTGTTGTYISSLTFHPDASGNVDQDIYVKYTPTTIGAVTTDLEFYDDETWNFVYQTMRGIGKGPEFLLEGRKNATSPWYEINDGETIPDRNKGTDFQEALVNNDTIYKTYKITNTKIGGLKGNLVLTEYETGKYVQISGQDADQFFVSVEPSSPILPDSDTTTYTLGFAPTTTGVLSTEIIIGNNDPDENPYNYTIQGTGTLTLPDPPTANPATSINHNSFYANWTQGGGGTTEGYFFDVATDNGFTNYVTGYENLNVGLVTTYLVTGLNANSPYYYRVRAYNGGGSSDNSNTQSLTTAPSVPTATAATNIGNENFYANWSFVSGATSYKLDVNTQSDFLGTIIYDNEDVTTTYKNITGLTGGTTYYYRVRSYNGNSSGNSNIITAITLCNAPTATDATNVLHNEFTANWNVPAGGTPDYYKLDVSISENFTSFVFGFENLTVNATTKVVDGLTQNTSYYYRVRAINVSGASANSNIISTHTFAGSNTQWTGNISTDWNNYENWNNGIPYSITDVIIASAANQPVINNNFACKDLTINPDASLTINAGYTLTVNGNYLLKSDATGSGSFIDNGSINITGSTTVQSYISELQWHLVSSPVSNATSNTFYDIYLKYFTESDSSWTYIEPTDHPLNVGQGFSAWASDIYTGSTSVNYTGGTMNTGNKTPTVTFNDNPGEGHGWNLIGNPYPSALEWNTSWTTSNIDPTIYVYDGSQYLNWNANTGLGSMTNGIIPLAQGFWIKASAASPSLTIPNSERLHSLQDFYKDTYIINDLLKLKAEGNGYNDISLINFNPNATEGFDNYYDAYKLRGISEAPQLYSKIANYDLSVNILPAIAQDLLVPLGFEVGISGTYSITVSGFETFDPDITIYLEDISSSDEFICLNENPVYSFTFNPEDDPIRFILHFTTETQSSNSINNTSDEISIYSYKNNIYINNLKNVKGEVVIYNIMGQEILRNKIKNQSLYKVSLHNKTAYYIVKLLTENKIITEKIFIE